MTKEEAKREMMFAKRNVIADSWIDKAYDMAIKASAQPEPEIYWGYTPTYERPLADREIIPRLRSIQMQVGGSYAIDRAIEIIEAVAERRTDEQTD